MFANIAKDDDEQQEQEEKYENENWKVDRKIWISAWNKLEYKQICEPAEVCYSAHVWMKLSSNM
jgi:hypothetical protein